MSTEITEKPPAPVTGEPQELEHQIRLRAYQFYESRGREAGHELDDWPHAEEEIASTKVRAAAVAIGNLPGRKWI